VFEVAAARKELHRLSLTGEWMEDAGFVQLPCVLNLRLKGWSVIFLELDKFCENGQMGQAVWQFFVNAVADFIPSDVVVHRTGYLQSRKVQRRKGTVMECFPFGVKCKKTKRCQMCACVVLSSDGESLARIYKPASANVQGCLDLCLLLKTVYGIESQFDFVDFDWGPADEFRVLPVILHALSSGTRGEDKGSEFGHAALQFRQLVRRLQALAQTLEEEMCESLLGSDTALEQEWRQSLLQIVPEPWHHQERKSLEQRLKELAGALATEITSIESTQEEKQRSRRRPSLVKHLQKPCDEVQVEVAVEPTVEKSPGKRGTGDVAPERQTNRGWVTATTDGKALLKRPRKSRALRRHKSFYADTDICDEVLRKISGLKISRSKESEPDLLSGGSVFPDVTWLPSGYVQVGKQKLQRGRATTLGHNCLIHSVAQVLHLPDDQKVWEQVRDHLKHIFGTSDQCLDAIVDDRSFLDPYYHLEAIVEALGQVYGLRGDGVGRHIRYEDYKFVFVPVDTVGRMDMAPGDVRGEGPNVAYIGYENGNHYVPLFPVAMD
jgi:hypothetical protein